MSKDTMLAAVAAAAGLDASKPVEITAALMKEHFPAAASALIAEGKAAGLSEGADSERKRLAAIDEVAVPGYEKLVNAAKADGAMTAEKLALAIVKADKEKGGKFLAALDKDEEAVKGLRSEHGPANGPEPAKKPGEGLVGEAKWKAEYAASAKLQAEFGNIGGETAYLAGMRAESRGLVRTVSPPRAA